MAGNSNKLKVIQAAYQLAAKEGLEGITIGRLAKQLEMSKSGVIGSFGTKEGLQVAVLKHAAEVFAQEVIQPNRGLEPGLDRLRGMLTSWGKRAFGNGLGGSGCFFQAAAFEYAGRPGKLKDLVAHLGSSWLRAITGEIATAIEQGEILAGTNQDLLAFEIHGLLLQAHWSYQLLGDRESGEHLGNALGRLLSTTSQFHSPIN